MPYYNKTRCNHELSAHVLVCNDGILLWEQKCTFFNILIVQNYRTSYVGLNYVTGQFCYHLRRSLSHIVIFDTILFLSWTGYLMLLVLLLLGGANMWAHAHPVKTFINCRRPPARYRTYVSMHLNVDDIFRSP